MLILTNVLNNPYQEFIWVGIIFYVFHTIQHFRFKLLTVTLPPVDSYIKNVFEGLWFGKKNKNDIEIFFRRIKNCRIVPQFYARHNVMQELLPACVSYMPEDRLLNWTWNGSLANISVWVILIMFFMGFKYGKGSEQYFFFLKIVTQNVMNYCLHEC